MTRKEAKKIAEAMMAYAEGKNIEFSRWGAEDWQPCDNPSFQFGSYRYRVQPEPKYRPFQNVEECWEEMKKHEPFGWVKKTCGNCNFLHIMELYSTGIVINNVDNFGCFKNLIKTYNVAFVETTFADGTPFGIKEE